MRVVVIGGGVAALEATLALHALAADAVSVTIVSPTREFRYRPASVAVPFGAGQVYGYDIMPLAEQAGATLRIGHVAEVDTAHRHVVTDREVLEYDRLVVACGARRLAALKDALTFAGEQDAPAMRSLLDELPSTGRVSVVFALPRGASWALPLYELALLTASHVDHRRLPGVALSLVTPEERPLAQFGGGATTTVEALLAERHIRLVTSTYPVAVYPGRLVVIPHAVVPADRVVCMPAARGIRIRGLPADQEGFLPSDEFGRVRGTDDVFAAGDITAYPIKQGGIAAQQAEVVAHTIAHQAGAVTTPPAPFRPILRGLLLTGGTPTYLAAEPTGGKGETASTSSDPLWWPGGKIAAPRLGRYLVHARHES